MLQSICVICEKPFEQVKKHFVQTCSVECAKKWRTQRMTESYAAQGTWLTATCANQDCGKEFRYRRSKPKKFCSKPCYNQMTHEAAIVARTCVECGNPMTGFKRQDQQFCSVTCRNRHTAANRDVNYPECRICGVSTGSYNRVFCDEHRPTPGRSPLPRRTAICKTCGNEFSRPGSWQGKMLYCSLQCSKKDPSYRRIKRYSFGNLNAEGGYELRFLACLQRLNIDWEAWPDDDPVTYSTPDRKQRTYTPDFRVDGLAVEVKGWVENPDSTQRYAHQQWDRTEPLILVGRESLAELERIFNREQFLQILHENITVD